ncbi:MAG: glycoside hydrolase family 31 protein [Myxococcaceae bacterium]
MFNVFEALSSLGPKVFADGAWHRVRTAIAEARHLSPHLKGVGKWREAWRRVTEHREKPPEAAWRSVETRLTRIAEGVTQLDEGAATGVGLETALPCRIELQRGDGAIRITATFDANVAFHGLGEKAAPLDLTGRSYELWNFDPGGYHRGDDPLYLSIPFIVAQSNGQVVGLFIDNPHRAWVDVGSNEVRFTARGGPLKVFAISGTPAQVLERYTALTGRPPLPPMWAFGFHQSRYSYYPAARVAEVAREFRQRRIPCDVLHLDIDYMDGYRCFTWHPQHFARPRELTAELHRQGFKALTIIDPGIKVDPGYRVYDEGRAGDHFIKWPDGEPFTGPVWPGACHFPDFSAERTRRWWGEQYEGLLDDGIDAIWNDMNEIALLTVPPGGVAPDTLRHEGGTHEDFHNRYGSLMAQATFEGLQRLRPEKRPVVLTRSGWAGVQKHALHWTGDNHSTWDHLRLSLQMVLNLGWSGIALTGPDTGGFGGGPTPELFARWMQLSAYLPFFRVHSVKHSPDQEPWAFGAEIERIGREAIERRYRLLPYLYSCAWQSSQTGAPIARSMSFAFGDDPRFAKTDDQFMLGDALLVAPVLEDGVRERKVLLPKGVWFDFETGEAHQGEAKVKANLSQCPVFLRGGAVVPLWPVQQWVGELACDEVELVCAPVPGEHVSTWYCDDGETPNPGPERSSVARLTLRGPPYELSLSFEGKWRPAKKYKVRVLPETNSPAVSFAPREV